MKVSLKGLFHNAVAASPQQRAYYRDSLSEVYKHLQDVVDGKHTIEEFAECYCIKRNDARGDGVISKSRETWIFDRYVNGKLMAEGGEIINASSMEHAASQVVRIFADAPGSVFVLRDERRAENDKG